MNEHTDSDLQVELAALRQRLSKLEAEHRALVRRRGFARGLALGLIPLAAFLLLGGSLLYGAGGVDALFIDPSGRVGIGTNEPKAQLDVRGGLNHQARYQRDDEPEKSYEISSRYHLSLTATSYAGKTKTIPQDTLVALCGDQDGCQVRLGMTRWGNNTQTETASRPFLFYYSATDGHWRAGWNEGDKSGIDGDDIVEGVRQIWQTCFFTDGTYAGNQNQNDREKGLQLLVWTADSPGYGNPGRTCELTLID